MLVQLGRIILEEGIHFQHHVVLVDLGVHRIDLPLAEGVVQGVIDGRGRDAEARGGDAVDAQAYREAARLLIGGDALELRQIIETVHETVRPQGQFVRIRILERVLVLRAAYPVIDRDILHGRHIKVDSLHLLEF